MSDTAPHEEPLALALLNRIMLSEIWFNYRRGPYLGELVEAFEHVRESHNQAKSHIYWLLGKMSEAGLIEKRELRNPKGRDRKSPLVCWQTTHAGRIKWLLTPESELTAVNDSYTAEPSHNEDP